MDEIRVAMKNRMLLKLSFFDKNYYFGSIWVHFDPRKWGIGQKM